MEKRNFPPCPVEMTMRLVGNKWKFLIVRDLLPGSRRFGELQRGIAEISQKVLTQNLRDMERDGLVVRKVFAEVPPRVEYTLSELGDSLRSVIEVLAHWGMRYKKLMTGRDEGNVSGKTGRKTAAAPASANRGRRVKTT